MRAMAMSVIVKGITAQHGYNYIDNFNHSEQ